MHQAKSLSGKMKRIKSDIMAEMVEILQVPQLDAKLPGFLNLAFYNLSAENTYLKEELHDALKDHVYARLYKYQKDYKAKRFSVMLNNLSFDLFSMSENSLAFSYADVFHKFRKDYLEENKHLLELQSSPVFMDVRSTFSGVKGAYNQLRNRLASENGACAINPDIRDISDMSAVYNDAVKKMANLFVECGIVSLEDVSDPKCGNVPESFQVLSTYIKQLNDFLDGSEDMDNEMLRDCLREIDSSFDSDVFDNVLNHIEFKYTGHKTIDWPGIYDCEYRSGKSSDDSLFGLIYNLNFSSDYSVQFWEDIFEDLGFEIQKAKGCLKANISFKDFMSLDLQAAKKN